MFSSTGTFRYQENYRLVVEVDQDLADYYRSLIPKWMPSQRPRWPAHITVVRAEKEIPPDLSSWGKYEGVPVKFFYEPRIYCGKIYYWLNIFCKRLEEIRAETGLSVTSQYTLPPEGFDKVFHMTIANKK